MQKIFVGIPILNRLDLLEACVKAIDYPADIVIVNNNSIDPCFTAELTRLAVQNYFKVLYQDRNLGVAASWNLLIRTAFARGYDWIFIGSNDTALGAGSLQSAVNMPKEEDVAVWKLYDFNFFLIHRHTIRDVGWFDENFYPAYKEDQDYAYRCALAQRKTVDVPGATATHVGSATIRSNPDYFSRNEDTHFNWNRNHYICKWGGDASHERYSRPYNDSTKDHTWWPDPGATIRQRDWDADARRTRRLAAVERGELHALGLRHGTDKATYHGYMQYYEKYLQPLRDRKLTLLEIGIGSGGSLRMWREYFPNADIVGVDINAQCIKHATTRIRVFAGDVADTTFLARLRAEIGFVDIVIDDGSHRVRDQRMAFENLFPHVHPGGMYVIEDLHTSFRAEYGGDSHGSPDTMIGFLKKHLDRLAEADGSPTGDIDGICMHPGICFVTKRSDAIIVHGQDHGG